MCQIWIRQGALGGPHIGRLVVRSLLAVVLVLPLLLLLFLGVATATGYSVGEATALLPSASSLLGRLRACTDAARRLAVGANYRNVLAADEHRDEMGGRRAAASKSGNAILAPAMDIDF